MPLWIPIAFLAIILWVIGNLTDKYLIEKFRHDDDEDTDANTLFLFSSLFAVPTALFAVFMGGHITIDLLHTLVGLTVGICNGFYIFFYLHAIAKTELSRLAPVYQTIPIFVAFLGWFFLGETLSFLQIISVVIIVTGAAILSYHRTSGHFKILPVIFILLSAIAVAFQFTLFKMTALSTSYWSGVLISSIGLFLFGTVIYLLSSRSRKHFNHIFIKKRYRVITLNLANELNEGAAVLVFTFATLLGPLALVQTVHAFHPVILFIVTTLAAKLGFDTLKEDISRETILQKTVGIALIGIGSAFVYIPLLYR